MNMWRYPNSGLSMDSAIRVSLFGINVLLPIRRTVFRKCADMSALSRPTADVTRKCA